MPRQLEKVTNDDVAQANGALNTFLAGRTKSWMTKDGNPVRPTPRPPVKVAVPIPSRTLTTTTSTQSMSNVLLSPTPSIEENDNRPQNVQNPNDSRSTENQSSNSPRIVTNPARQSINGGSDYDQNCLTTASHQLPGEQQAAPRQTLPALPSTAYGSVVQVTAPTTENLMQGQLQMKSSLVTLNNMAQAPSVSQTPNVVQTASTQQSLSGQPHVAPYAVQLQLPSAILQDQSRASPGTITPSHPARSHQSTEPIVNPPKRRRTYAPVMPSLHPRAALIHQYIQSRGGIQALSAQLERPRFLLLEQACIEGDSFYLALHQLFCFWDVNNQSLPIVYQFPTQEILRAGFRILGQLIKANNGLTAAHLQWLAQFPTPLDNLLRTSEPYRRSINSSCNFLYRLGNEWDKLSEACRNRGYPPLVDELVKTLGCLSPILQQIIFTASRRNLGFEDDNYGPRMEEIFRLDKNGHKSLALRYHTASPPTEREILRRNEDLVQIYHLVMQQRVQSGQQVQPNHARRVSGSARVQNSTISSNGHNSLSTESRGSDLWNAAQNHLSGHIPAPISIASRSSSAQVAAGSPSPTLMQNLSMNTPNQPAQYPQYAYPSAIIDGVHQPLSQMDIQNNGQVQIQQISPAQYSQYLANNMQRQQVAPLQQQIKRNSRNTVRQGDPRLPPNLRGSQFEGNIPPFNVSNARASLPTHVLQNQAQVHHPVEIYAKTHPLSRSLIPPARFVQPPQPTNPDLTALHHAHLRSPKLVSIDSDYGGRFYQTIKEFAVTPVKIPFEKPFRSFQFTIDSDSYHLLAKDISSIGDKLATRYFKLGTTQYRLRCIRTNEKSNICPLSEWTISDTSWPETIYAEVNGKALEVRRKNLYGKDLPIDITGNVLPQNQLRLSIPKARSGHPYYFFAIECLEILHHDQILKMCSQNRIPLNTTMESIKKSLKIVPDDDDDEFQMVATDLSIDLADPFTARIFDVPVRSTNCLHRECFDLETFLQTRNSKPKRLKQPSMVDQWKCPLCSKDARPYNLQIDEFLLSVRAKLAEEHNLEVKAILVSGNGEWRPKPLPPPQHRRLATARFGDSDSEDGDKAGSSNIGRMPKEDPSSAMGVAVRASELRARKPAPQVIELDSD